MLPNKQMPVQADKASYNLGIDKEKFRLDNLDVAARGGIFSSPCTWVELCSLNDPMYQRLVNYNNVSYIGVNWNRDVIDSNRACYPKARWIFNDLFPYLESGDPALKKATVLNYDGYTSIKNNDMPWYLDRLFAFAQRQYCQTGKFLLIINLAGRGTAEDLNRVIGQIRARTSGPVHVTPYRSYVGFSMYACRLLWG